MYICVVLAVLCAGGGNICDGDRVWCFW